MPAQLRPGRISAPPIAIHQAAGSSLLMIIRALGRAQIASAPMSTSQTEKSQRTVRRPCLCTTSANLRSRWSVQHLRSILRLAPARLPNRESYHTVAQHQHGASTHMPTNLWQPGVSGNPAGRMRGSRNALSEEVICALLRDFRKHGERLLRRCVGRNRPHTSKFLHFWCLGR